MASRKHYVGGARNPHKPKAKAKKPSQYAVSLERTVSLRDRLRGSDLLPLFDHLVKLAEDDYRAAQEAPWAAYRGRRAGIELRRARKLAEKHGRSS